jgi:hypothetical protein
MNQPVTVFSKWSTSHLFSQLSKQNRSWQKIGDTTNIMITLANMEQCEAHRDIMAHRTGLQWFPSFQFTQHSV